VPGCGATGIATPTTDENIQMQKKRPSSFVVWTVVLFQGLLTFVLLVSGLGYGFSVPKPIPSILALAALSGAAVVGLIIRKRWAFIPAALLTIGLGFAALLMIGVSSTWMPGIEFYLLILFGLVMLIPIATIVVSLVSTGIPTHQARVLGNAESAERPGPD
jgi:uncharacterized membrane protein YwaF